MRHHFHITLNSFFKCTSNIRLLNPLLKISKTVFFFYLLQILIGVPPVGPSPRSFISPLFWAGKILRKSLNNVWFAVSMCTLGISKNGCREVDMRATKWWRNIPPKATLLWRSPPLSGTLLGWKPMEQEQNCFKQISTAGGGWGRFINW